MNRTLGFFAFLALAAALVPRAASAQTGLFFDEFGASPRASAMGQAYAGIADDPSAAYYNPAGLTQATSPFRFFVGYQFASPDVRARFPEGPENNFADDLTSGGPLIGVCSHLGEVDRLSQFPSWVGKMAIGMVVFVNVPEINQFYNPQRMQDPYFLKYNERWSLLNFAFSIACELTDWLSVGAGIIPTVASFQDSRDTMVAANEAFAPDSDDPTRGFRLNLRQETKISAVPVAGILLRPPIAALKHILSLGISYRGEVTGYYGTGPTRVDIVLELPDGHTVLLLPTPEGRTVDFTGYNPEQVSVGLGLRPGRGFTIGLDCTWKNFSQFRFFWDLPPEPRFRDIYVPRGGVEYAFSPALSWRGLSKIETVAVRLGYYREPSPVPHMDGRMNILDSDQHVLSAGFGIVCRARGMERLAVDLYFQAHLLEDKRIENDEDPLFGPIDIGGEVFSGGLSVSVEF